nr:MAG TPA: hypothetical protein [Caudoviricetes sp.]
MPFFLQSLTEGGLISRDSATAVVPPKKSTKVEAVIRSGAVAMPNLRHSLHFLSRHS